MIKDFKSILGFNSFQKGYDRLLKGTLSEFFSANISLIYDPIIQAKIKYGIDITHNPKQEVYLLNNKDNEALLVPSIKYRGDTYLMGIVISGNRIALHTKILNSTCKAVASIFSGDNFAESIHLLDDSLIVEIICKQRSSGYYNPNRLKYIIRYMGKLRSTTFEGAFFSTGLILTKAKKDYQSLRGGQLMHLDRSVDLFDSVDNRIWYLADGESVFYLMSLSSSVLQDLFILNEKGEGMVGYLFTNNLRGGDIIMRVEKGRFVSIIDSAGIEYLYQGNVWHLRNYGIIKETIQKKCKLRDDVYQSLMLHILDCSRSGISTIIWVPDRINTVNKYVKKDTKNRLSPKRIFITNRETVPLVRRVLSSDGATIISRSGELLWFGCIVDNSKLAAKGVKGTGETAAKELAKNGLAIKVSQDGAIKVFLNGRDGPLKF